MRSWLGAHGCPGPFKPWHVPRCLSVEVSQSYRGYMAHSSGLQKM